MMLYDQHGVNLSSDHHCWEALREIYDCRRNTIESFMKKNQLRKINNWLRSKERKKEMKVLKLRDYNTILVELKLSEENDQEMENIFFVIDLFVTNYWI